MERFISNVSSASKFLDVNTPSRNSVAPKNSPCDIKSMMGFPLNLSGGVEYIALKIYVKVYMVKYSNPKVFNEINNDIMAIKKLYIKMVLFDILPLVMGFLFKEFLSMESTSTSNTLFILNEKDRYEHISVMKIT